MSYAENTYLTNLNLHKDGSLARTPSPTSYHIQTNIMKQLQNVCNQRRTPSPSRYRFDTKKKTGDTFGMLNCGENTSTQRVDDSYSKQIRIYRLAFIRISFLKSTIILIFFIYFFHHFNSQSMA